MGKVLTVASFFLLAPLFLVISTSLLLFSAYNQHSVLGSSTNVSYGALPTSQTTLRDGVVAQDARVELLRQFFARYHSPLEPYALHIVETADVYGLDFRLLPAIAMQESNLCKKAPKDSYNCWGFGIWGGKVKRFNDYSQAIETISKTLAKEYKGKGLSDPHKMMTKYTPSSNGSWAQGVNFFLDQLQ